MPAGEAPTPEPVCGAAEAAPVPSIRWTPVPLPVWGAAEAAPVAARRTVPAPEPVCAGDVPAPEPVIVSPATPVENT